MNNLDTCVAELPDELIVYGECGQAGAVWANFERIVATLRLSQKLGPPTALRY